MVDTKIRKMLRIELSLHPDGWTGSLRGCGFIVINPPFTFEAEARAIAGWLAPALGDRTAHAEVTWLAPE